MLASALFAAALLLYILPAIMFRPLYETSELQGGVSAREMIQDGNYLFPKSGGKVKDDKPVPPLPYWLAAGCARVIGGAQATADRVMTRAVELPSALFSAATVFLVVLYGCAALGRVTGFCAGLILSTLLMATEFGRLGFADSVLMFFCAGVLCSAAWIVNVPQPGILSAVALGVCLGLGTLTHFTLPVALLLGVLVFEIPIRRAFNGRKISLFIVALVVAVAIVGPWLMKLTQQRPDALNEIRAGMEEALAPAVNPGAQRWTYYIYALLAGLLPWTPLLLVTWLYFFCGVRTEDLGESEVIFRHGRGQFRFFFLAAFLGFAAFYLAPVQNQRYLLPLLPPFALASGYVLSRMRSPGGRVEEKLAWIQILTGIAAAIAIGTLPSWPAIFNHVNAVPIQLAVLKSKMIVETVGTPMLVVFAVCCLGAHLFMARQCVEGKPLKTCLALAVLGYFGLMVWGFDWTKNVRENLQLSVQGIHIRKDLDSLPKDTSLYATGVPGATALEYKYYLQKTVGTIDDLAKEPTGQLGGEAPSRAIVIPFDKFKMLELDQDLQPPAKDAILVISLPKDVDWPKWAQGVGSKKKNNAQ